MIMEKSMNYFIHTYSVDYNNKIKPSGILDLFQDIAALHASEIGVGKAQMDDLNMIWVVLYIKLDFINDLPKFSDYVKVSTWPKVPNRLEFSREYKMENENNELLVKAISTWVVLDSNTHRFLKPTLVKFNGEYKQDPLYDNTIKRKLGIEKKEFTDTYQYKVGYRDLDVNKHMNNARYLDIVYDMQKNMDKKIKSIEIGFVNEAKPNDIINVGYYNEGNFDYYMGYIDDKLSFEVKIEVV